MQDICKVELDTCINYFKADKEYKQLFKELNDLTKIMIIIENQLNQNMKIEINLLNKPSLYHLQLQAVNQYIKNNSNYKENIEFVGIKLGEIVKIKETLKNTGIKIELDKSWVKFYVSCRKTKNGLYKFKVWKD